jgi:mevalonate kinase
MKAVAQAPAKAIITGEHFVVHGSFALAAALEIVTRVEVRDSRSLEFKTEGNGPRRFSSLRPAIKVVNGMALRFGFNPRLRVTIKSEVPTGAGLGSSAALMVALVSALSEYESLHLGVHEIIEEAMVGERMIHGRPSGIDAAVSGLGGILLYSPESKPKQIQLTGRRRVVIVNSGRTRRTKQLIRRVAQFKADSPGLFSGLVDSVSEMGELAVDKLASGDMEGLGRLLTLNHAALRTIGVSTPQLDSLVDRLLSLGSYGAKLTGAGGGGSVLAVMPEGKEKSIISEVKERGLEAFVSVIPVEGVKSWQER